jgi:hypothetical protein
MLPRPKPLTAAPTRLDEVQRPDDRFVPIEARDLCQALCGDIERFGAGCAKWAEVFDALCDVIAQEADAFERELVERYQRFNPDRDTLARKDLATQRTPDGYADLSARLEYLLRKANFEKLDEAQLRSVLRAARARGFRVRLRPERIDYVSVWVRGQTLTPRWYRSWKLPLKRERASVTVFRRLVLVFRLKDEPYVQLKLFKEIPMDEVEGLLPHAEPRMSWLDRIAVLTGGAGMAGSAATKIFSLLTFVAYWGKIVVFIFVGALLMTIRTMMGYRTTRVRRDWQRTRHLYYRNLDNNAGVIHALVSMIAQEDAKETLLAYAFCRVGGDPIASPGDLAERIERYLKNGYAVDVDFDVADALQSLARFDLWVDPARFHVLPPDEAVARLRAHWMARRSLLHHANCSAHHAAPTPTAAAP